MLRAPTITDIVGLGDTEAAADTIAAAQPPKPEAMDVGQRRHGPEASCEGSDFFVAAGRYEEARS